MYQQGISCVVKARLFYFTNAQFGRRKRGYLSIVTCIEVSITERHQHGVIFSLELVRIFMHMRAIIILQKVSFQNFHEAKSLYTIKAIKHIILIH